MTKEIESRRVSDLLLQDLLDQSRETNKALGSMLEKMAAVTTTVEAHKITLIALDTTVDEHEAKINTAKGWIAGAFGLGGSDLFMHIVRYFHLGSTTSGGH